jgi:tetratricopeptide (TPR) repeat protein
LALLAVMVLLVATPRANGAEPSARGTAKSDEFGRVLELALEHYRARRFAEARTAFEQALAVAPPGESRDGLEFNIAACDYELGRFRDAEQRFARLAEQPRASPSDARQARLHAGWAALAVDDLNAAEGHVERSEPDLAAGGERAALATAIQERRRALESRAFDDALGKATAAYEAGDLAGAEAGIASARRLQAKAPPTSRAALDYLEGLLAHERGDDERARAALQRSSTQNPNDGAAFILLGELAQASGDSAGAERHYRQSLATDLTPAEANAVRVALDALYPLPRAGFAAWALLGAGYDSNAMQSGSSDALGYATASAQASPFVAPAWGVEYRIASGGTSRFVPYYRGDWLLLSNTAVEDASLQSHEVGARWHWAPTPALELRLGAGGGLTLSGLELSPFSVDGVLRGRASLEHGPSFRSALAVEVRPSFGLSGRDYLNGARTDVSMAERFERGPFAAALELGFRYAAMGTQQIDVDASLFPLCMQTAACNGARYEIPLGYSGPMAVVDVELQLAPRLVLGAAARYEHRTYLAESRVAGPALPPFVRARSEKTRVDDRYTLAARARQGIASKPDLGVFAEYALRISRSNVARRAEAGYVFDYDNRNFTQHIVELGLDARL